MSWTYILTGLDLWTVWTVEKFGQHCSQSCVHFDETTWRPQWETPLENPWKRHFRGSNFQNIPRCLGPQELAPLARVQKAPTIHYQPATSNFWQPCLRVASSNCSKEKSPIVCSLTSNNTKTIERMTCHCFLRPIRGDLTSSSYATQMINCMITFLVNFHIILAKKPKWVST